MFNWIKKHKEFASLIVAITGILVTVVIYFLSNTYTWYEDYDEDGFGNPEVSQKGLRPPIGFVRNAKDCYDKNKEAKPGTEVYFEIDRGDGSFDYDCDGTSTRFQTISGTCSNGKANEGWNGAVPECGKKADWLVDCDRKVIFDGLIPKIEEIRESKPRLQKCR
ncbi:MAG: hypothetical protein OXH47_10100 [Paracoccaceae bacterium]|nr:hypothetical protein [Paracoccaceae bacterium]